MTEPSSELAATWLADHGDMLYAYALRRVGRPDVAEDLLQDTLLSALESWPRFKGDSAISTWLVGILRHKILDELRRRKRGQEWLDKISAEATDSPFKDGFWIERQRPPSPLETEEANKILRAELDAMSEPMRLAFTLRELDGISSRIVCDVLDITPTNLWTLVHRAKLRMRAALAKSVREDQ